MSELVDHDSGSWIPDDNSLRVRLAKIRAVMGWKTVTVAAKTCGVPVSTWRNWEAGAQPHKVQDVARRIAERTAVDYGWIVGGPDSANPTSRGADQPPLRLVDAPAVPERRRSGRDVTTRYRASCQPPLMVLVSPAA